MSMIFDGFPDKGQAEHFAAHVRTTFDREATVCDQRDDSIDPFPFELDGPVVYVERKLDYSQEPAIKRSVIEFGGVFAGT